jgi:uncharacterized protein YwgA
MSMQVLGSIIKRIDNFDMDTFKGRLILQKRVYFLQTFGVYLGYNFSWYIYGPYSSELADDGYKLTACYKDIPQAVFANAEIEKGFEAFLSFLGDKKNDAEWLELLASIHFLKRLYTKESKTQILERVRKKQEYFNEKMCENGWMFLVKQGLIKE